MATGKKCKVCKEYLHYEQIQGMRLKKELDNGKFFFNTWCPKCGIYDIEISTKK